MAHVVGVPRRDPCQKCKMPVFLAERLTVGKKVYHRTCLKCARCGSQLTPGSFYETEVDDVFCCETCPDEEEQSSGVASVQLRVRTTEGKVADSGAAKAKPVTRGSIAERLAFFERSRDGIELRGSVPTATTAASISPDTKLLQKSVTDEEKRQSLQRNLDVATFESASAPSYKPNTALSSFLNETIDGAAEEESEPTSTSNTVGEEEEDGNTTTEMEISDNEDEWEVDVNSSFYQAAPALPTTMPPLEEEADKKQEPNKRFTATAQLQLFTSGGEAIEDPQAVAKIVLPNNLKEANTERKKSEIQFNLITTTTTTTTDNTNNNNGHQPASAEDDIDGDVIKAQKSAQKSLEINLAVSESNDNDNCVTKDSNNTTASTEAELVAAQNPKNVIQELPIGSPKGAQPVETVAVEKMDEGIVELRTKFVFDSAEEQHSQSPEDTATTERLSVVRSRLQQFEVIATNTNSSAKTNNANNNTIDDIEDENNDNANPENDNIKINKNENAASAKLLEKNIEMEAVPESMPLKDTAAINEVPESMPSTETNKENIVREEEPKPELVASITAPAVEESKVEKLAPTGMKSSTEAEKVENIAVEKLPAVEIDVDTKLNEENEVPFNEAANSTEIRYDGKKVTATAAEQDLKSPAKSVAATPVKSPGKTDDNDYPEDLNPFKSDDEDDEADIVANKENLSPTKPRASTASTKSSLNPFDSSDDDIELEKSQNSAASPTKSSASKVPPPRPPPPRISRNPFGEEEDDANFSRRSSLNSSQTKRTPVPTPRTNISQSQTPTPEPTPRLSTKAPQSSGDYYGSANSLGTTPQSFTRNSEARGSNNSLTSSSGGTIRGRKARRAPPPPVAPVPPALTTVAVPPKELFPSTETIDSASTPSSSNVGTPKSGRKKRTAPAPPKPARIDSVQLPEIRLEGGQELEKETASKNSFSYPLQSESDSKLSDEEKALLEGKQLLLRTNDEELERISRRNSRRIIPLGASLLEDYGEDRVSGKSDDIKRAEEAEQKETHVVYRRVLIPPTIDSPTHETKSLLGDLQAHDRQLEKLKDNKEANNRNRQSQLSAASSGAEAEDSDAATLFNKSAHGKWKRRKGPAPALPIPPRKVLQMLPLQEIRHELDIIEVQQQGLEKQGVILEQMIRDRCEGQNGQLLSTGVAEVVDGSPRAGSAATESVRNSKEVEDLILQLFELVNEKNELFRRQAELMYLRRQHRLEQEQADLEYEIRVLMAQPERNKTDTDKAREEKLIARMVEVVQLRNEVIECLEMDRLREAEEDLSIKQRLELHTAKRAIDDEIKKSATTLSKKEKKKQKEAKKSSKSKKIDADKDADESELSADKQKLKKKKKKFLFSI